MNALTRREFLRMAGRLLAALGSVALLAPVVAYFYPPKLEEVPPEPVLVAKVVELPPGAGRTVAFGRYPALVINTPQGLRGYSAVCTHFACICKWDESQGYIACPCHAGQFDALDGHVLSGPPPTPLAALKVEVVGDEIYVGAQS
jgi:cytochrome b6-f complex iron-sulfur subunit